MIKLNFLKRDQFSKAIINTDSASYRQHRYDQLRSREITDTILKVKQLKNDVTEIKDMLRVLLNGKNNG